MRKGQTVTVHDIYNETKNLTRDDRAHLIALLLDDLPHHPHDSATSFEEFVQMERLVAEGVASGPGRVVTSEYWESLHHYVTEQEAKSK